MLRIVAQHLYCGCFWPLSASHIRAGCSKSDFVRAQNAHFCAPAPSSSGPGYLVLIQKIAGSNPAGVTKVKGPAKRKRVGPFTLVVLFENRTREAGAVERGHAQVLAPSMPQWQRTKSAIPHLFPIPSTPQRRSETKWNTSCYHKEMNIPDTNRKRALIIIDLQPAFVKPHNQHIVPSIVSLIKNVPYDAYIEAVFHAEKGSLWDLQQGFTVPQDKGMRTVDEVMDNLKPYNPLHVIKETRSTFKGDQDLVAYFKERGIEEVHLVGTETHDCVLATAYDAFAAGFPVYALEECIESGTLGRHEVGLTLLRWQSMTNNSCRVATTSVDI